MCGYLTKYLLAIYANQRAVFSKCFANIKKAILHLSGLVGCNYLSPGGGTCQGLPTLTKHCKQSEFKLTQVSVALEPRAVSVVCKYRVVF